MVDMDTIVKIKKEIKQAEEKKNKAQGKLEQLLETFKDEFECNTVEEAEEILGEMEAECEKAESKCEAELEKFKDKWNHILKI